MNYLFRRAFVRKILIAISGIVLFTTNQLSTIRANFIQFTYQPIFQNCEYLIYVNEIDFANVWNFRGQILDSEKMVGIFCSFCIFNNYEHILFKRNCQHMCLTSVLLQRQMFISKHRTDTSIKIGK